MNSTKLILGLAGVIAAGAGGVAFQEHFAARHWQSKGEVLQRDAAAAREAADAAQAELARQAARLEEARREREQLMALRGEIGVLRDARRDLARALEENQKLRAAVAAGSGQAPAGAGAETAEEEGDRESVRANGIMRLNFAKTWALAFMLYAAEHDDRMPATFAEAEKFLPAELKSSIAVMDPDRFEIVYQGRLREVTKPAETILLREKEPFTTPTGNPNWRDRPARTYAFADGHSEIHMAPDGNFEDWERDRIVKPTP